MNCFNQQFSGMMDAGGQDTPSGFQGREEKNLPAWKNRAAQRNSSDWQTTPWGGGMPGWNGQADNAGPFFWQPAQPGFGMPQNNQGMDCSMPPATIPAVPTAPGPMREEQPVSPKLQPQRVEKQVNSNFACKMEAGKFPIAMGYVPMQRWCQPRPIAEGLVRGTIFRELDLPFMMGRCQ